MEATNTQKKRFFSLMLTGLLLLSASNGFAQFLMSKSLKADHTADEQKALAISSNGDVYISINAKELDLLRPDGQYDVISNDLSEARAGILAKLDPNGILLWSNKVAATGAKTKNTQITAVYERNDGYVYVTGGVTCESASAGTASVFGITCPVKGFMDFYVAKLDASTGLAIWAKTFGTTLDWELPTGIVADQNGNVFISGIFSSRNNNASYPPFDIVYKDNTTHSFSVNANWGEDFLTIKLDALGDVLWAHSFGSIFKENGSPCLAIDNSGNLIMGGVMNAGNGNLTAETEVRRSFAIGSKTYVMNASQSKQSILVKYSGADGSIIWSRFFAGDGYQELLKVSVDRSTNQVTVTGKASGEFRIEGSSESLTTQIVNQPSGDHAMLVSFDGNGNFLWDASPREDTSSEYKALTSDNNGNFYVSGYFNNSIKFNNQFVLSKTGSSNTKEGLIAKYNASGQCVYAESIKGSGAESINLISVAGDKLVLSGDRTTDVVLPFADMELGNSLFNNHKWYYALYRQSASISGISSLDGKRLVPFSYQITPAFFTLPYNFNYSLVSGSLPAGWQLNAETGLISGKATTVGSGAFRLKVLNTFNNASVEKDYSYNIIEKPCDILSISPANISNAVTGPFYQKFTLENGEGKIIWSAENLPAGVTLNDSTGILSGTLHADGNVSFTIKAKEESGCETSTVYSFSSTVFNYTATPYLFWISQIKGSGFDHAKANAIDKDGNIFVASTFRQAEFSDQVAFIDNGTPDAMFAKYNGQTGSFIWARGIGGSIVSGRNEQGQAVATDPTTGDVIVTGIMTPYARIGDLSSNDSINTLGGRDLIVTRFTPDGTRKWYKLYGSSADWEAGLNTTIDKKGNIYVVGYLNTNDVTIPLANGEFETLTGGSVDLVVLKLNADGNCLWAKRLGGPNKDGDIFGLVTDNDCNVYLAGTINGGSALFGSGKSINTTGLTSFICKYNENGTCQWVTPIGANGTANISYGRPLSLDKNGNIYYSAICTGTTSIGSATITVANDKTDGVLFQFNNNGEYLSYKQFASTGDDGVTSVVTDKDNNVYVVGYFGAELPLYGSIKLQLLPGTTRNAFVAKYSPAGDYIWGFNAGCIITDAIRPSNLAISIDPVENDIILSGPFYGTMYPHGVAGEPKNLLGGGLFISRYKQTAGIYGTLPEGNKDNKYATTLYATGFQQVQNLQYSILSGNLPAGLSLNAVTGEIKGIPTNFGKFTFTVKATDGVVTATKELFINIKGADCNIKINTIVLEDAANRTYYEVQLKTTGANGNVTWSVENPAMLPQGLSIKTVNNIGYLFGTPNAPAQEYMIKFVAEDEANCKATRTAYLNITGSYTSIESVSSAKLMSIYPNPVTNGTLNLSIKGLPADNYQLIIHDMLGTSVYAEEISSGGDVKKEIPVNKLAAGIYFITIQGEGYKEIQKFIIK